MGGVSAMPGALSSITAVIAVGVVLLGGCGGDSSAFTVEADTTVSPREGLTKAGFTEYAQKICMRNWHVVLERFLAYREGLRDSNPSLSSRQRFIRAVRDAYFVALEDRIVAKLRRLGAPRGEEQTVEAMIGAMQEAIERGRRGRPRSTRAEVRELLDDYNSRARSYGLRECVVGVLALPRGRY